MNDEKVIELVNKIHDKENDIAEMYLESGGKLTRVIDDTKHSLESDYAKLGKLLYVRLYDNK